MIQVKYLGQLGNNLFQYALGRIIAEELGFKLEAAPLNGFSRTSEPVLGVECHEDEEIFSGQYIDLDAIFSNRAPRKIVLDGLFQQYDYFKPYKSRIKDWFQLDSAYFANIPKFGKSDVVIHVRLTDYLFCDGILPHSYYQNALERMGGGQVFICTDDPKGPYLRPLIKSGYTIFQGGHPLEEFAAMMSAPRIIISQSTFSWWAVFLSQAQWIGFPKPLHGYWEENSEINLFVNDETRYELLECKDSYRPSAYEKMCRFKEKIRYFFKGGPPPIRRVPSLFG